MPVRGLSEVEASSIGSVYLTAALGVNPAGHADGRPLNGSWADSDTYDPNPGTTQINAVGKPITTFMPTPDAGVGRSIEIRLTRCDPALIDLLNAELDGGPVEVELHLVDGRVWVGEAIGNRLQGAIPIQTSGDHQHFGGQLKEVIVKLLATEGDWEEEP